MLLDGKELASKMTLFNHFQLRSLTHWGRSYSPKSVFRVHSSDFNTGVPNCTMSR